LSKKHW